ncbi:hypothetical protein, variant [Sphaeroforma arctica JP610]|uniref:Alpha-L-rhamnosidase six-hairpin glycosidase domain-containing protein n=1 Tax=Sphaeroforma arctica JP610 TaxID=667725 RepID=A0A0L0FRB1_9EUKA|nr:hypothetical protein, variant [Sphaeroforma arctica JP610]KNC78538.1 hypothetical protein, variant [Sphaeroforma arctica JP610]|eukprot:XP_014152440.1 hypothetical protein, variant [Sphaeroforma arctica JP610]
MTNELPENKKNEDAATTGKIENGIGVYTIDFDFKPIPDLRPTWLGERTKMVDGKDEIYRTNYIKDDRDGGKKGTKRELWAYQDSESEWTVMAEQLETVGSQAYVNWNPHRPDGLRTKIILHPGESACVRYIMAGGINAQQAYDELWRGRREWEQLYDQKAELYDKAARASDLTMSAEGSDKNTAWVETFATMFRWLKYNSLWLGVDVEGWEGVTLSAGLADYPWLFGCDSEYAILGLNALGLFELSDNTLKTLHVTSEKANSNGRVVHEVSTNGAVYHHGNLNETPQFVTAVWNTFLWTGDITKLEFHFEFMKKGMAWLVSPENDPDGDGIPNGTGMIEIANMDNEMIDVAVYTARAWEQLAMITRTIKASEELAVDYDKRASKLRAQIAEHYWIKSEKAFADVRGTPTQARVLVLQAIERAKKLSKPWAVAELELTLRNIDSTIAEQSDLGNDASKQGFVTHHNWIVNTPMEVGYGDCVMGRAALDKARNYTNPFGLFVTGIDRDETAGNDWEGVASTKSSFSYEGAVMTLGTGVVAVGESVYGRPQKAMEYLEMLTRSFSFALPGSQYEVSPDFGMMTQAWNVYAGAYPVVCQFFGIEPLAHKYSVYFSHQMPKLLSATTLNGIRVGKAGVVPKGPKRKSADNSNSISVHYSKIAVGGCHARDICLSVDLR